MRTNARIGKLPYLESILMLELRQLKAFVAIAEEGYITRAAERLGMQQPPLTRLLQSLETQLGVVLMLSLIHI